VARTAAGLLAAALLTAAPAAAQSWQNDVRLRAGIWQPEDLPTDAGPVYGIEFRNLLWANDGFYYGASIYDEQSEDTAGPAANPIRLEADIRLVPVVVGWFHQFRQTRVTYIFGAGIGLYESNAFSGGVSATAQFRDFGDYRFLQDDTYVGFNTFFGADFFPGSRWGLGVEARLHVVENDFSAAEFGVSGLYRF
jgi:hypothetical protein